jgi:hypothetical protein
MEIILQRKVVITVYISAVLLDVTFLASCR